MSRKWFEYFVITLIVLMFMPAGLTAFYLLQTWQERYFPVLKDVTVSSIRRDWDNSIRIAGLFNKAYGFCEYQGITWTVEWPPGVLQRVGWDNVDQPNSTPTNRPAGLQSFGPWTVYVQKFPEATHISAVVDHKCFKFWPAQSHIGPVELPPAN